MGRRAPEQDPGFHFHRLAILGVWFELPLLERSRDHGCLIGKCAEKVNVLYLAVLSDDDPDRNRSKAMLGQNRIDARDQVLVGGVILDAYGQSPAALSSRGG